MQRHLAFLAIFCLIFAAPLQLWADTAGPTFAGTGADDSSIGTTVWASLGNITASDDAHAAAVDFSTSISHYLKGTNYSFSIPSGARVDGITCEVEQRGLAVGAATIPNENSIRLVDGAGTIVGDNKSTNANLPTVDTFVSYGGATDDWNASLTDLDINDVDFGCVFAVDLQGVGIDSSQARVDSMRITVDFTLPSVKLLITHQTRKRIVLDSIDKHRP